MPINIKNDIALKNEPLMNSSHLTTNQKNEGSRHGVTGKRIFTDHLV
jgi:hypothetical protein